jgi:hypothetical protein
MPYIIHIAIPFHFAGVTRSLPNLSDMRERLAYALWIEESEDMNALSILIYNHNDHLGYSIPLNLSYQACDESENM